MRHLGYKGSRREEREDLSSLNKKLLQCHELIIENWNIIDKHFVKEINSDDEEVIFYKRNNYIYGLPGIGQAHLCNFSFTHKTKNFQPCFMSYIDRSMLDEIIQLIRSLNG